MKIGQAEHLPLVAAFLRRIGLADAVNACVPTEMAVDVGTVVSFMVLDTLSGRSPICALFSQVEQAGVHPHLHTVRQHERDAVSLQEAVVRLYRRCRLTGGSQERLSQS